MKATKDPTKRFSKTVDNYVRYRPGYPVAILSFMREELGLESTSCIGDIGSGTGQLSKLFLQNGNRVFAVEPNDAMRLAGEAILKNYPGFHSIKGTAEQTGLASASLDFLVAAQAFHWFDIPESRKEFLRILKPGAWVLLIWNKRVDEASGFMQAYEDFINTYSTDLKKVNLRFINHDDFRTFFGHSQYQLKNFYDNVQIFDWKGLKGRYLSCSYALDKAHEQYNEAMEKLELIYDKNQVNGQVKMIYRTEVYYGRLKS